jgi:hypothetical protein
MATDKKTMEFTGKNVKVFTDWLKRFALIDNSLLLEIDQEKSMFIAKTYNEERSVVKMSSLDFEKAELISKDTEASYRIKVGIFNIPRLIKIMDQFNSAEFTIKIEYQELVGDNDTQYAAEKLLLKNKYLKMNVDCTSLNIFKYISDDLFTGTIAAIDSLGEFNLSKESLEQINTLNALDNEHRFMEFKFKNDEIFVSGKTYELRIGEIKGDEIALSIFKEQYASLDNENYIVNLSEDRLIFKSNNSDTTTVISKAEDKD